MDALAGHLPDSGNTLQGSPSKKTHVSSSCSSDIRVPYEKLDNPPITICAANTRQSYMDSASKFRLTPLSQQLKMKIPIKSTQCYSDFSPEIDARSNEEECGHSMKDANKRTTSEEHKGEIESSLQFKFVCQK